MQIRLLITFVKKLVADAIILKDKYVDLPNISANYVCIFAHSDQEYMDLDGFISSIGKVLRVTKMGNIFQIDPIDTSAGKIQILKIRKPDPKKWERGYVDFTVPDYKAFKEKYVSSDKFHIFERPGYEILGINPDGSDVRVYFANPPLDKQFE